jgi:hypothetical protein
MYRATNAGGTANRKKHGIGHAAAACGSMQVDPHISLSSDSFRTCLVHKLF